MSNIRFKIDLRKSDNLFLDTQRLWKAAHQDMDVDSAIFKNNLECIEEMVLFFPKKEMTFGEFLKHCRKFVGKRIRKKVTQKVLAGYSGLSLSRVTFLEGDRPSHLYLEEILKLEKSLNIPFMLIISIFGRINNLTCENDRVFNKDVPPKDAA